MKPMGSVFYDLSKLLRISDSGELQSICPKTFYEASADVVLEGVTQGFIDFSLRLRIITPETDQILRRKREGDMVTVDASLGLEATQMTILNENPTKNKTATVFDVGKVAGSKASGTIIDFLASKMIPTNKSDIYEPSSMHLTRILILDLDNTFAGMLEIELLKATALSGLNYDNGKLIFSELNDRLK